MTKWERFKSLLAWALLFSVFLTQIGILGMFLGLQESMMTEAYREGFKAGKATAGKDPILWWTGETDLVQARKKLCSKK